MACGAGWWHRCREGGPGGSGQLGPEGRHLGRGLAQICPTYLFQHVIGLVGLLKRDTHPSNVHSTCTHSWLNPRPMPSCCLTSPQVGGSPAAEEPDALVCLHLHLLELACTPEYLGVWVSDPHPAGRGLRAVPRLTAGHLLTTPEHELHV